MNEWIKGWSTVGEREVHESDLWMLYRGFTSCETLSLWSGGRFNPSGAWMKTSVGRRLNLASYDWPCHLKVVRRREGFRKGSLGCWRRCSARSPVLYQLLRGEVFWRGSMSDWVWTPSDVKVRSLVYSVYKLSLGPSHLAFQSLPPQRHHLPYLLHRVVVVG